MSAPAFDVLGKDVTEWPVAALSPDAVIASGVKVALSRMAAKIAPKPLVVFFDEVDCLGGPTLITFLRQLRNGKIDAMKGKPFPTSVALVGMRDIRDYRAKLRHEDAVRDGKTLHVFFC